MADKGKGIADDSSSSKRKRNGDDKSGNRKRKNLNVLQFFEDTAFEIDESGSSDDDDFINDDITMFFEEELGPGPGPEVKAEPKTPSIPFYPKEEEIDEEDMDKLMEARYKPGAGFVKYAEDRPQAARMDERNTVMQSLKDPTIWKVKCTVGRERHSVFCLMQKYVDVEALGTKLQIISAFAVEHVKGFIYIEAEKQCDINEACKGLCNIFPSRVAAVPVSEVPHLFSVRSKYSGVSTESWARVKNGKYKGDLARVVFVDKAKRKATVKLVPRIDLQAVAEKFGGGVTGKKTTIPAPRLIPSSELEPYRPLVQCRRDRDTNDVYEVFDGMTLKDGYLYKKVPLDSLSFWDVRPSEAELLKFTPANKEESNDVEWLTGLFGERTKKKPTISNKNTGGKGEGSSSSAVEDGFEVPDLVLHGRKAFGIVVGREKDDRIKVLEEGSDRPMVVAVEARSLKKADFDKKFTVFDQHKKIISINDTVRILEGPLEDKRGIVKQIYKGVIFLHDENESENCGYFCAKAKICEKMASSVDMFKGGKGGKSDASGFDDFPTSPKSPLSPNKAWEGRETTRNFDTEDKEGLSVGQACRIRVGPLKGYMCRVMAIRYSDITVKLDSQHKILTVKSEHLVEVREKSSAVSTGDGQDSAKPFELLGEGGSSQGWMDAGAASEPGGGGWNTAGPSTERSSWAPFSANPSNAGDNDANKDAGGSAWDTKTTQEGTPWGASSSEAKTGGWGASSSGVKPDTTDDGGWGGASLKLKDPVDTTNDATPWGNAGGSNGGENKSAWGSAPAPASESGGWGSTKASDADAGKKDDGGGSGWGGSSGGGGSGWGGSSSGGGSGWGGSSSGGGGGWGSGGGGGDETGKKQGEDGTGGWGSGKKDDAEGSGWKKSGW
ncbi:putative ribosomal protein L2, domain 2 [Helianthus annuus]|nr:putative ribosomal protein L2, domain 2 [Helianthus annuus]